MSERPMAERHLWPSHVTERRCEAIVVAKQAYLDADTEEVVTELLRVVAERDAAESRGYDRGVEEGIKAGMAESRGVSEAVLDECAKRARQDGYQEGLEDGQSAAVDALEAQARSEEECDCETDQKAHEHAAYALREAAGNLGSDPTVAIRRIEARGAALGMEAVRTMAADLIVKSPSGMRSYDSPERCEGYRRALKDLVAKLPASPDTAAEVRRIEEGAVEAVAVHAEEWAARQSAVASTWSRDASSPAAQADPSFRNGCETRVHLLSEFARELNEFARRIRAGEFG